MQVVVAGGHGRAVAPVLEAFVAGTAFIRGLVAFPPACRQRALLFVVSAILLACILVASIALLVPWAVR